MRLTDPYCFLRTLVLGQVGWIYLRIGYYVSTRRSTLCG